MTGYEIGWLLLGAFAGQALVFAGMALSYKFSRRRRDRD